MVRKRSMAGVSAVGALMSAATLPFAATVLLVTGSHAHHPVAVGFDMERRVTVTGTRRLLRTLRGRNQARRRYDTLWRQCAG